MGVDEDVENFEDWAQSLGLSAASLPPKKTLNRIFSSGNMLAFNDLMRRVRPQQEVKAIRDEVKVRKIERLGSKPSNVKKAQSEELYLYETKQKLLEKSTQLKTKITIQQQQYEKLSKSLKDNNIQILQLKEDISGMVAKDAICKLKSKDIERQIEIEKEVGKKIDEITPAKYTGGSGVEKEALDAVEMVKMELEKFYSTFNTTDNYEVNLAARQQLWQKLRESFTHIPNLVLWNTICDQFKQKQQSMETLVKMDLDKILYADDGSDALNHKTGVQFNISKLHAKHIKLCVMRHCINKKSEQLNTEYVLQYEPFLSDMRMKFAMYNNQNIDDDFLADYLNTFSTLHFGKGEIEYLLKTTEANDLEIERRKKANEQYNIANTELLKIYEEIENLYIRTHEDLYNLAHVREKIQHSEELIQYMLQCKKDTAPALGSDPTNRLNSTLNSSTGSNNDSALYSSRSDSLNSTGLFARSDMVVARSVAPTSAPNHLNEIKTFLSIPIEKFKLRHPTRSHMDLSMNPILIPEIFNQLPNDAKQSICDYLLTPEASIKHYQTQSNWVKQMEAIDVNELISPDALPEVDEVKWLAKKNQQNDVLAELCDDTAAILSNTERVFRNIDRYMNFINENPLSKWVPKTETFNGKTYQQYEQEFMMYYNMIEKPEDS